MTLLSGTFNAPAVMSALYRISVSSEKPCKDRDELDSRGLRAMPTSQGD